MTSDRGFCRCGVSRTCLCDFRDTIPIYLVFDCSAPVLDLRIHYLGILYSVRGGQCSRWRWGLQRIVKFSEASVLLI